MSRNDKQTSSKMASKAGSTLANPNASAIQRSLAASALAQAGTGKQTSGRMEAKAGKALANDHSSRLTRSLAATVTSQSNKKR
jgi:hypothetical protein